MVLILFCREIRQDFFVLYAGDFRDLANFAKVT